MIKKFLRWLQQTDEWEAAYDELKKEYEAALAAKDRAHEGEILKIRQQYHQQYPDHNLAFGPFSIVEGSVLLEEVVSGSFAYRLYQGGYVYADYNDHPLFIIQMAYENDDREYTIRVFSDEDTEYAENCAREAFHYLTAEI